MLFLRGAAHYGLQQWPEAEADARSALKTWKDLSTTEKGNGDTTPLAQKSLGTSAHHTDVDPDAESAMGNASPSPPAPTCIAKRPAVVNALASAASTRLLVADLQQLLALSLAHQGELWGSIAGLSAALTLRAQRKANCAHELLQRGTALLLVGRYDAAAEDFHAAVVQNPGWAIAYHRRGLALAGMLEYAAAAADLERAARIDPKLQVNYHDVCRRLPINVDDMDAEWQPGADFLVFWDMQEPGAQDVFREASELLHDDDESDLEVEAVKEALLDLT